jgi:hypothetical protein
MCSSTRPSEKYLHDLLTVLSYDIPYLPQLYGLQMVSNIDGSETHGSWCLSQPTTPGEYSPNGAKKIAMSLPRKQFRAGFEIVRETEESHFLLPHKFIDQRSAKGN